MNQTSMFKEPSILKGEVVQIHQNQAGFTIGIRIENAIHYFSTKNYLEVGTKVTVRLPESEEVEIKSFE